MRKDVALKQERSGCARLGRVYDLETTQRRQRLSAPKEANSPRAEVGARLGHDYAPHMLSAVSHCYQWVAFPLRSEDPRR